MSRFKNCILFSPEKEGMDRGVRDGFIEVCSRAWQELNTEDSAKNKKLSDIFLTRCDSEMGAPLGFCGSYYEIFSLKSGTTPICKFEIIVKKIKGDLYRAVGYRGESPIFRADIEKGKSVSADLADKIILEIMKFLLSIKTFKRIQNDNKH